MKNIKNKTKNMNKAFIPAYIVDITDAKTVEDVVFAFAMARIKRCCTMPEISVVVNKVVDIAADVAFDNVFNTLKAHSVKIDISDGSKVVLDHEGVKVKKPGIFKRFWNWLTRKNK